MKASEQARSRRLRRICLSLELDAFAGEIIVDLLERLEELQRDLDRLRPLVERYGIRKR